MLFRSQRLGARERADRGVAGTRSLLDLGFFVSDVLTRHGIVFLDLHFLGMEAAILRRRVVVPGPGGRHQADLVALARHSSILLDMLAASAELGDDPVDALLVDDSQTLARNLELHVPLLVLEPKANRMQIRQEAPARLVIRVGNRVPVHRGLARYLADS